MNTDDIRGYLRVERGRVIRSRMVTGDAPGLHLNARCELTWLELSACEWISLDINTMSEQGLRRGEEGDGPQSQGFITPWYTVYHLLYLHKAWNCKMTVLWGVMRMTFFWPATLAPWNCCGPDDDPLPCKKTKERTVVFMLQGFECDITGQSRASCFPLYTLFMLS